MTTGSEERKIETPGEFLGVLVAGTLLMLGAAGCAGAALGLAYKAFLLVAGL